MRKTPENGGINIAPKENFVVDAILNATRRLTAKSVDAIMHEDLEQLWKLISCPPWVKPYIPHLHRELKKKLDANPDLSIEDAIADLDISFELESGYIVVVDLNAYSNFQNQATDRQKAMLDKDYQRRMFQLSDIFATQMLQAPAGDAFIFYLDENAATLNAFLEELKRSEIKIPLTDADPKKYPHGCFTFSTGVAKSKGGEDLRMSFYTAAEGLDHGLIDVGGAAFVNAVELQKHVGPNNIGMDADTKADLQNVGAASQIKARTAMPLPENPKEAVALMAAIVKASHARGSISTINRELIEDLPSLGGITTIAIYAGNLKEIGKNPEAYRNIGKKLLALRAKYPNFFMFKKDEAKYHIHTNTKLDEAGGKRIIDFCREAAQIVEDEKLGYGIGVGYTETMVRTRIPNSSLEERAGTGIVKAVHLATTPEKAVRLDGEFCKAAFGNIFELESVKVDNIKAKGCVIPCVTLTLNEINFDTLEGKTLIGFEPETAKINEFLDLIGKNGSSLEIASKGSGYGVSAIIRHAMRYAKTAGLDVINIERCGTGKFQLMRGFLRSLLNDPRIENMGDEEILQEFASLLLNTEVWGKKRLLVLDQKNISEDEKNLFQKLAATLISTNTCLIHSQEFEYEHSDKIELNEFTPENAAKLILRMNKNKWDPDIMHDAFTLAFKQILDEEGHIPLTARNLIHIYAAAMVVEGKIATINRSKLVQVQTGELTQKVKELDISEERILLLGMIAYINVPLNAKDLAEIYTQNGGKGAEKIFDDLRYLCERGFIKLDANTGEYSLKDNNEKNSAISLAKAQIDEEQVSAAAIQVGKFPENVVGMEAKLEHLLNISTGGGPEVEILIQKIGSHYFKHGNLSAARKVYAHYLPMLGSSTNKDLQLDIAWAFHNGDEEQMRATEEICSQIDSLKSKWISSRLLSQKIKSNLTDELCAKAKTEMSESEMNAAFHKGRLQDELKKMIDGLEQDHSPEADLLKFELRLEEFYQRVNTYKFFRYEKRGEKLDWFKEKKAELITELEEMTAEYFSRDFENCSKEIRATVQMYIGLAYSELLERAKSLPHYEESSTLLNELETPDYKHKLICLGGAAGAKAFLLQDKIETADKLDASWRAEVDGEIDDFEASVKVFENVSLSSGDSLYRAEASQMYADAIELRMRAIIKFPLKTDAGFQGNLKLEKAKTYVDRYLKIKRIINNPAFPQWEAQAKAGLNKQFEHLPKEAR